MKTAALSPAFMPSLPPLPLGARSAAVAPRSAEPAAVEPFELPLGWRSEAFAEDLLEENLAPAAGIRRSQRGVLRKALAVVLRRR